MQFYHYHYILLLECHRSKPLNMHHCGTSIMIKNFDSLDLNGLLEHERKFSLYNGHHLSTSTARFEGLYSLNKFLLKIQNKTHSRPSLLDLL